VYDPKIHDHTISIGKITSAAADELADGSLPLCAALAAQGLGGMAALTAKGGGGGGGGSVHLPPA